MKITLEHYGVTYTAKLSDESDLESIRKIVRGLLFTDGFQLEKINEWFPADDFDFPEITRISSTETHSTEYNVGDLVEITDTEGHVLRKGEIGTLVEIEDEYGCWLVERGDNISQFIMEHQFKPATETEESFGI